MPMLIFRAWATCDSIALTAKKVVANDFYRLTDMIDINKNLKLLNYRFIFRYCYLLIALAGLVIYRLH